MPGNDRISELPEPLLTQILSYLPTTKDTVKTSVLSSRWKNMWLNVPKLNLDCYDFPLGEDQVFFSFLDRFLAFNSELRLQKLKLKCWRVEADGLKDRIGTVVSRGVKRLVVWGYVRKIVGSVYKEDGDARASPSIDFLPMNLYTRKTLVSLKLGYSGIQDPGVVSMPCLKFMHLEKIMWIGAMDTEKLLSGCPVLEELILVRDLISNLKVKRVKSRSLKRFSLLHCENYGGLRLVHKLLEIDTPALEYMSIEEDISERTVVKNLSSLLEIALDIRFRTMFDMGLHQKDVSEMNEEIRDFLTGISSVRDMTLYAKTVAAIAKYSEKELIPEFTNLSRLEAVGDMLQFLPAFLESCPNLKHLILKVFNSEETEVFSSIDVPRCLLSTLERVEIKASEEEGMKIVNFFLENSPVLKKLIVNPELYKELKKFPECSRRCQIIIGCGCYCDCYHGISS